MRENTFDFTTSRLLDWQNKGPMEDLQDVVVWLTIQPHNAEVDENRLHASVPLSSMTPEEENPDLWSPSRRRRIANGSGNTFIGSKQFIKRPPTKPNKWCKVLCLVIWSKWCVKWVLTQIIRQNMPNMPDMGIWTCLLLKAWWWRRYARSCTGSKPNAWWWS